MSMCDTVPYYRLVGIAGSVRMLIDGNVAMMPSKRTQVQAATTSTDLTGKRLSLDKGKEGLSRWRRNSSVAEDADFSNGTPIALKERPSRQNWIFRSQRSERNSLDIRRDDAQRWPPR